MSAPWPTLGVVPGLAEQRVQIAEVQLTFGLVRDEFLRSAILDQHVGQRRPLRRAPERGGNAGQRLGRLQPHGTYRIA